LKLDTAQTQFLSPQYANAKLAARAAHEPVRGSLRLRTTARTANEHVGRFYQQLGLRRAATQAQDGEGTRQLRRLDSRKRSHLNDDSCDNRVHTRRRYRCNLRQQSLADGQLVHSS
jgi:hypothetical protein